MFVRAGLSSLTALLFWLPGAATDDPAAPPREMVRIHTTITPARTDGSPGQPIPVVIEVEACNTDQIKAQLSSGLQGRTPPSELINKEQADQMLEKLARLEQQVAGLEGKMASTGSAWPVWYTPMFVEPANSSVGLRTACYGLMADFLPWMNQAMTPPTPGRFLTQADEERARLRREVMQELLKALDRINELDATDTRAVWIDRSGPIPFLRNRAGTILGFGDLD
jgi:hypothetical protein